MSTSGTSREPRSRCNRAFPRVVKATGVLCSKALEANTSIPSNATLVASISKFNTTSALRTVTTCDSSSKPTKEAVMVYVPGERSESKKCPSISVVVPREEPSMITEAPGSSSSVSRVVTVPERLYCAQDTLTEKKLARMSKIDFIGAKLVFQKNSAPPPMW